MRTPGRSHSDDSSSSRRRVRAPRGRTSGAFVASVCPYRRCHSRSRLPLYARLTCRQSSLRRRRWRR
eukprot:4238508-Prymnesium_polylepis.1